VRGRRVLRTSQARRSQKFARTSYERIKQEKRAETNTPFLGAFDVGGKASRARSRRDPAIIVEPARTPR
jgi:hypothetical protein